MALSQQDLDQAYQYVLSKGLSIQSLDDGGTDLSRMYLAPIIEYSAAGTAAKLVRLAVTLLKAKELELQRFGDGVQWRREGESWNNLFTLLEIKGDPGDYPVLRVTNKGIEGKLSSEPNEAFTLLVPYETIRLTFSMLTEEQKNEIRFHFSDFTDADKAELQKPAQDAADRLNTLSDHRDEVRDGYWWRWNEETGEWYNTGEIAKGNVMYATFDVDPATGELAMYTDEEYAGPGFELNNQGELSVVL